MPSFLILTTRALGTAEEYSYRIAKEIKAKYGVSPLVFDPENISDFATFDELPEDSVVVFVVATYGEGEPTDNLVPLMDYFKERSEPLNVSSNRGRRGSSSFWEVNDMSPEAAADASRSQHFFLCSSPLFAGLWETRPTSTTARPDVTSMTVSRSLAHVALASVARVMMTSLWKRTTSPGRTACSPLLAAR